MKAEVVRKNKKLKSATILLERHCSVRRTVEIVLDSWSFLILREAFFGVKRFDKFQSRLGIPRQTLSNRLKKLVQNGLLSTGTRDTGRGKQYYFTFRGKDLFSTMLSLMEFGDKWLAGDEPPPLRLIHTRCGKKCHPITVCGECKKPVKAFDVAYRDGAGAGYSPPETRPVKHRSSDPKVLQRIRPCSVARSLAIIGDRWSFLILREGWFGVRRFDEMRENLGIATNILADRLNRLVKAGVLRKVSYSATGDRFEYRFTRMGIDLYKPMLVMMAWGDKWLSDGNTPLRLRHRQCGHDFQAQVVCSECLEPLRVTDTDYTLTYTLDE